MTTPKTERALGTAMAIQACALKPSENMPTTTEVELAGALISTAAELERMRAENDKLRAMMVRADKMLCDPCRARLDEKNTLEVMNALRAGVIDEAQARAALSQSPGATP